MKLKDLLKGLKHIDVKNAGNPLVTGIVTNSKNVRPGEIYVAYKGLSFDGRDFIEEAMKGRASCVITDIYNPFLDKKVVQIITKTPKELGSELARRFYKTLENLIAVTGTNGKTTVSFCIKQILDALNLPCALVGTCLVDTLKMQTKAHLTTPDGISLSRIIHEAASSGAFALASEVSSHALDQKRVMGHKFKVAVFTNLTHDHLDYHQNFESYGTAKLKLFEDEYLLDNTCTAVINLDDAFASTILNQTKRQILTFSLKNPSADFFLTDLDMTQEGFSAKVQAFGKTYEMKSPLVGEYNVSNLLAAIISCYALYPELDQIIQAASFAKGAPGRLEKIGSNIFIDYAHTPDGLENVLGALKKMPYKKIRLVFGCGGDRDKAKRPKMAQMAELLADEIIVTSDNPRTENPETIINEILSGFSSKDKVIAILSRQDALEKAVLDLPHDTALLIAGKGHETTQIIGHTHHAFDERLILMNALKKN
jgi:UDP-N-acetylmuramoyl-L-alanyl-D-glutamate--2,6-diaminopimelate ligase